MKKQEIYDFTITNGYTVLVAGNEKQDVDITLQKFKRKIEKSGKLDIFKEKQYYLKPSLQKRAKRNKNAR